MPSTPARSYPAIYARFLRTSEPTKLGDARIAANPYKRQSLRDAFDCGWYAYARKVALGDGFSNPLLSRAGRSAWRRGWEAREEYIVAAGGERNADA